MTDRMTDEQLVERLSSLAKWRTMVNEFEPEETAEWIASERIIEMSKRISELEAMVVTLHHDLGIGYDWCETDEQKRLMSELLEKQE